MILVSKPEMNTTTVPACVVPPTTQQVRDFL